MKCVYCVFNKTTGTHFHVYLADTPQDIPEHFDPNCSPGSLLYVISENVWYIRNTAGKWQQKGSTAFLSHTL